MNNKNNEDFFKLLANPYKLKKEKNNIIHNDINENDNYDELFLKIKKIYPEMIIYKNNKNEILKKIETVLVDITIENILKNIISEIEYDNIL